MSEVRWYVVADSTLGADEALADEPIWTLSLEPDRTGWETDSGCPGYGLPKALAQELADAANKAWREARQAKAEV